MGTRPLLFPESDSPEFAPFTRAFVRMMFAHSRFEHRIAEVASVIAGHPDFGETKAVHWTTKSRPKELRKLCEQHVGEHQLGLPEAPEIERCLTNALPFCTDRDQLTQGTWWLYDSATSRLTVRLAKRRPGEEQHRDFNVQEIEQIARSLGDLEAKLHKLQAAIEERLPRL
jgi:hypothetical protein